MTGIERVKPLIMPARAKRKRTWMAVLTGKKQKTTCHVCAALRTGVQKKEEALELPGKDLK